MEQQQQNILPLERQQQKQQQQRGQTQQQQQQQHQQLVNQIETEKFVQAQNQVKEVAAMAAEQGTPSSKKEETPRS